MEYNPKSIKMRTCGKHKGKIELYELVQCVYRSRRRSLAPARNQGPLTGPSVAPNKVADLLYLVSVYLKLPPCSRSHVQCLG